MKIVLVVPVFITGGAEVMVQRLAVGLKERQADVEVVSIYPRQENRLEEAVEQAGVRLHFMDKQGGKDPLAMVRLWKLLNRIRPDVIHGHLRGTFYALPWAIAHNVPLIHTIHARPEREFTPRLRSILNFFRRKGKLWFMAVSERNRDLVAEFYGLEPDEVPYVNNPVDTKRYYHRENRGDGRFVYINVGRQDGNKNQILALRALPEVLRQVPNARLILVGDGPRHDELRREAEELGIQDAVEFPGETPEPEAFLAEADVYLSTSHSEGLPLSMLEAEAAGLPVIATRVGGVPDIVRENGVLIEDNDASALAKEMIRFAKDPELVRRCGAASREIVKCYDADACAERHLQLYQRYCPGKRAE